MATTSWLPHHGYHINCETLEPGWKTLITNFNDRSNEGIAHETRPYFIAQFFLRLIVALTQNS